MYAQHSWFLLSNLWVYKNSSNEKILFKIMNYSFFLSYKNFLSLLLFFQTICHMDIDKYSYIDFEKISFVRYYFYRLFTGSCVIIHREIRSYLFRCLFKAFGNRPISTSAATLQICTMALQATYVFC